MMLIKYIFKKKNSNSILVTIDYNLNLIID